MASGDPVSTTRVGRAGADPGRGLPGRLRAAAGRIAGLARPGLPGGLMLEWLLQVPRRLLAALIRGYQLTLSPLLPASCRFHPSCSQYTLEAVRKYGAVRGGWLGVRRLVRCHPWNPGGFDPVP